MNDIIGWRVRVNPKWQFRRLKKLSNGCCIIEFCIQNEVEGRQYDWELCGTFLIANDVYDKLLESGKITRDIDIEEMML